MTATTLPRRIQRWQRLLAARPDIRQALANARRYVADPDAIALDPWQGPRNYELAALVCTAEGWARICRLRRLATDGGAR